MTIDAQRKWDTRSARKRGRRRNPVTILVGMNCKTEGDKPCILVGSDSQETVGGVKRSCQKIYDFKIGDRDIVIAGAGSSSLVARAMTVMKERSEHVPHHTPHEIARIGEYAIDVLYKEYVNDKIYTRGRVEALANFSVGLLIGIPGDDQQEACLFSVLEDGQAEHINRYVTCGSGYSTAEYIIVRAYPAESPSGMQNVPGLKWSIALAAYAIAEVKRLDVNCGGETQLAFVGHNGEYRIFTGEDIRAAEQRAWVLDLAMRVVLEQALYGA